MASSPGTMRSVLDEAASTRAWRSSIGTEGNVEGSLTVISVRLYCLMKAATSAKVRTTRSEPL
ncbi:hypothetical protein D3C87_1988510 [compost metagenome]